MFYEYIWQGKNFAMFSKNTPNETLFIFVYLFPLYTQNIKF